MRAKEPCAKMKAVSKRGLNLCVKSRPGFLKLNFNALDHAGLLLKTAAAIELVCAMATKPAITDGRSTGKNDGVPDRH
jgi:hypothetical protein